MTAPPVSPDRIFGEIGSAGLKQYSGVVEEEFLLELRGRQGIEKYKEMWHNSSIIGALVRGVTMLTRQVDWHFESAKEDDAAADKNAQFVDESWRDMSQNPADILAECVQGVVVFGWEYKEIVYKQRNGPVFNQPGLSSVFSDGKIGWRKFASRSQDTLTRWVFDPKGGVRGMVQLPPPDFQLREIPIVKSLLFRHEMHKNNPEGLSMLRNAYRSWYFAKKIEEIEGIGIERDLAGLPVIEHPAELSHPNATTDQKIVYNSLKTLVRDIRRDEQSGVTLPQEYDEHGNPMYKLSLLNTGGRRQIDTNEVLNRLYAHIAMTLLADWLVMGHEKVGSFALASSKTELFAIALGSLLDSVAMTINRHAVPRLLRLNGMDEALAPKLVHGDIETQDIQQLASGLQTMANAGMPLFPDEKLEGYLRTQFGLPEIDSEARDKLLAEKEEERQQQMEMMQERTKLEQDKKPKEKVGRPEGA